MQRKKDNKAPHIAKTPKTSTILTPKIPKIPKPHFLSKHLFWSRLSRNGLFGLLIISTALFGGMLGYHYFENLSWTDAFLNASMILSGMGPVDKLQSQGGKIFSGSYALLSGTLFLVIIAIVFAPLIHRFFRLFHLADEAQTTKKKK